MYRVKKILENWLEILETRNRVGSSICGTSVISISEDASEAVDKRDSVLVARIGFTKHQLQTTLEYKARPGDMGFTSANIAFGESGLLSGIASSGSLSHFQFV